jgi:hypothetical protein
VLKNIFKTNATTGENMKPYIFGIGKPKTGSNSLCDALELLGLKCYHTGREQKQKNRGIHNQLLTNLHQKTDPLRYIDDEYECLVDYPIHAIYQDLYEDNNNAKFILTYRPPDDVALSWLRMLQHKQQPLPERLPTNFHEFSNGAREHVTEVFDFFMDKPGSLLVLDVRDPDEVKWSLLAKFLEVKKPNTKKYPHSFDHTKWQVNK